MNKYCIECGAIITGNSKFCSECGVSQEPSIKPVSPIIGECFNNPVSNQDIDKKLLIKSLKQSLEYFSHKQHIYDRVETLPNIKKTMTIFEIILRVLLGSIISFFIILFAPKSYNLDLWMLVNVLIFGFFGIVIPLKQSAAKKQKIISQNKLIEKEINQLKKELKQYYEESPSKLISFEYSNPRILSILINNVKTGRADTLKETINVFIDDVHNEQMLLKQQEIALSSQQAANAAQASAIFSAGTYRNTRKLKR